MAEEEIGQKKGSKGMMIALIALLVILILVIAGGGFYIYSSGGLNNNNSAVDENGQTVEAQTPYQDFYKAQLNDMVLNITTAKGREKLMKLSFTISSTSSNIEQLIEDYKSEIIDMVISLISARNSEELLTVGGKELLKEELIQETNIILNRAMEENSSYERDSVKNIFFTAFVIK
jgi:flagellar FliL protein